MQGLISAAPPAAWPLNLTIFPIPKLMS